jgi:hypothetical protein
LESKARFRHSCIGRLQNTAQTPHLTPKREAYFLEGKRLFGQYPKVPLAKWLLLICQQQRRTNLPEETG